MKLAEVIMENESLEVMTISETAKYLRVSISSLYKLAQDGRIPCQKVGKHWRFRREAIDHWLEQVKPAQRFNEEGNIEGTLKGAEL